MKRIGGSIVVASLLAGGVACAPKQGEPAPQPQRIGMANPASEHCVKKGGKLELRKDKEGGGVGICHLPDGTQVEEWELFRRDNPASNE